MEALSFSPYYYQHNHHHHHIHHPQAPSTLHHFPITSEEEKSTIARRRSSLLGQAQLPITSFGHGTRSRWRRRRLCVEAQQKLPLGYEVEGMLSPFILPPPPGPVKFPRKTLDRKFAVLLMRSAYDAVDDLDFIPMDRFQVKFWKLRQSEVEPYSLQYSPLKVKYGDLTDPLYFDFISFGQFAAISNEMRTGEVIFQEKLGVDGTLRTVQRDEKLRDNALLPSAFNEQAGKIIYERLLQGFEDETFDAPKPCPSAKDSTCLVEGIKRLLQVFVSRGYCLKANVEIVNQGTEDTGLKLKVRTEGGATLWGMRTLASRGAVILTNFTGLVIATFLQRSGCTASCKVRLFDTYLEDLWTIL